MERPPIEPKRASFLGLATETRLEIYSYLLIPYNTAAQQKALQTKNHCCAISNFRRTNRQLDDDSLVNISCDCRSKNLHPSILRTNRQIFTEAAQILYENMEFHVRLPRHQTFRDSPLQYAIAALPKYSHQWIHRIVIVGSPGNASEKHRDSGKMTWRWPMEQYVDLISATFPNMQHVRLHIDFGSPKNGRRTAVESFGFVMGVPRLESVVVEVDGAGLPGGPCSWAKVMRERVVQFVLKARRCYCKEGSVVVREVLEDGEVVENGEVRVGEEGIGSLVV